MYLIVDLMSDYKAISSYKDLRYLLIERVLEDTRENVNEECIVLNNLKILEKLAKESTTNLNYIKEELLSYSYKVIDLYDIQRDLEDLKQYFAPNEDSVGSVEFKNVINIILEGAKNGK